MIANLSLILMSISFAGLIIIVINRWLTFFLGYLTLKKLVMDYITIKKVKALKEMQDDYFASEDKKNVGLRHLDILNSVQKQRVEDHLESCIGYYPNKVNIFVNFIYWLFSTYDKFAIPEMGYNYMLVLMNFVESNNEYLNFEVVVREKTETQ